MPDPNAWGKHGWKFIHYVALGYPDQPTDIDKQHYKNFITNIQNVLPCKMCREHFVKHLENMPVNSLVLKDRDSILNWTIELHNKVNEVSNKPPVPLEVAKKFIKDDSCIEPVIEVIKKEHTKDNTNYTDIA